MLFFPLDKGNDLFFFAGKNLQSPVQSPFSTESTSGSLTLPLNTEMGLKALPTISSEPPRHKTKSVFVLRDPYDVGVAGHLIPRTLEGSVSYNPLQRTYKQGIIFAF